MTPSWKSKPEHYAGAFQQYDEIPERYRLATYSGQYSGKDTWSNYLEEILFPKHDSERLRRTTRLGGSSWKEHMADRDRHHALATPEDVEAWCQFLLEDKLAKTCYEYYFLRIYDFYDHLRFSRQHPHLYNPLLLAAIDYDATREIWMVRVNRRKTSQANQNEASNE